MHFVVKKNRISHFITHESTLHKEQIKNIKSNNSTNYYKGSKVKSNSPLGISYLACSLK